MESSVPSTSKAKPKSKAKSTNSKTKEGNAKKKKQKDEGSQSSLIDFVALTKSDKKKKKEKEKQSSVTNSGTKKKHVKKKKRKDKDKELLRSVPDNFTEIKQIDSTKKGKEKVGKIKTSIINSDIDCAYPKKKKGKGEESQSNNVTNYVVVQHASNEEEGMDKAGTSTVSNNKNAQNGPQKNKQKEKESMSTATNSESELNDGKRTKGKDIKENGSSAKDSTKHQRIPTKRKRNSEVKPGSSKRRKKDGSPQQSHEESGRSEDALLLIQHPHLANHIKGQLFCEGLEATSFTAMSNMIKECVLQEKWEDANRILCAMCLYQTPNVECLWKFGAHVLQNHPSGNAELVEDLYRFVRKINMINPYQKKLEHALFLLRQNRMKDAFTTLTEMWGLARRWAEQQSYQPEIRKKMNSAYIGLVEYCQWHEKTKNRGDDVDGGEIVVKEARLRRRALTNLGKFRDEPGVWDIFITKQVEMLEVNESSVWKAGELLTDYLGDNPGNPNAHVYLYQFLKRHNKRKRVKPVLKKLATILPAEDYTLEYVNLLLQQKGSADSAEVLPMLFNMADYSTCRYNTALWETLVDHVITVVESKSKSAKALLKECWSCRKSWWTSYHFDKQGASGLVERAPEVAMRKAILASIFFGSSYPFVQNIQKAIRKIKPELSEELENEISLWCNPAL